MEISGFSSALQRRIRSRLLEESLEKEQVTRVVVQLFTRPCGLNPLAT
jgi:hypothetical protein